MHIKWITDENQLYSTGDYSVVCGDLNGKEIQKREDTWTDITDSFCRTAEINTTL